MIARGSYEPWAEDHSQVYAFIREHEGKKLLVLNNFYGEATTVDVPQEFVDGEMLISNYESQLPDTNTIELAPYQSMAVLA